MYRIIGYVEGTPGKIIHKEVQPVAYKSPIDAFKAVGKILESRITPGVNYRVVDNRDNTLLRANDTKSGLYIYIYTTLNGKPKKYRSLRGFANWLDKVEELGERMGYIE